MKAEGLFSSFKRSWANAILWISAGVCDDDDMFLIAVNTSNAAPRLTIASENGKLNVRFSANLLKQT